MATVVTTVIVERRAPAPSPPAVPPASITAAEEMDELRRRTLLLFRRRGVALSVSDIVECCNVRRQRARNALEGLERLGLLTAIKMRHGRSVRFYRLTEAGARDTLHPDE